MDKTQDPETIQHKEGLGNIDVSANEKALDGAAAPEYTDAAGNENNRLFRAYGSFMDERYGR